MSSIYMNQHSTLPLIEGDQDQSHFPTYTLAKDPPLLFPFVITKPRDQEPSYGDPPLSQQVPEPKQFNDQMVISGPSGLPASFRTVQSITDTMIERYSYDPYDIEKRADGTGMWTPAKMRIMKKMMDPEGAAIKKPRRRTQAYEDQSQNNSMNPTMGVIRVCSDCNTTKTPLWRSGPCGPKSLCNACGIRQRKARRAMAAAAAAANGGLVGPNNTQSKPKKEKRPDIDRSLPFKKRCKMVVDPAKAASKNDLDNIAIGLGKNPAFHRAFPQDETTDAAILLMTLSFGLVRS